MRKAANHMYVCALCSGGNVAGRACSKQTDPDRARPSAPWLSHPQPCPPSAHLHHQACQPGPSCLTRAAMSLSFSTPPHTCLFAADGHIRMCALLSPFRIQHALAEHLLPF
eukprot:32085-Chlamydomonas_euryale.AAC.8